MASPDDTNTTARQKIDEEIIQLKLRILSLKSTRNTLSTFARLHHEIIQEIFVRACPVVTYRSRAAGKTALKISWVCRSWRDIAHRTSEIWSFINFIEPTRVRTALGHSRNRPLSFHFQFHRNLHSSKDCKVVTSLCLEALPRTKMLDMENMLTPLPTSFPCESTLWLSPAPLLDELTLKAISLPPNVFSGIFPSLQQLRLSRCTFHWESLPVPPGLKMLSITAPTSHVSVDDFIRKLSTVQSSLEKLRLDNVFTPPGDTPNPDSLPSSSTRLQFPHLLSFDISEDNAPPLTSFFNRVSTPVLRDYSALEVCGEEDQYETLAALVSSCSITELPVGEVDIILGEDTFQVMLKRAPPIDPLSSELLYLTFATFNQIPDLIPFLQQLPLAHITTLTLGGSYFDCQGFHFIEYFNQHAVIDTLNVDIYFVPMFTVLMRTQNDTLSRITGQFVNIEGTEIDEEDLIEQCRNTVTFPRLTELKYHVSEPAGEYQFHRTTYKVLHEWLLWRRALGLGLKKLIFEDMYIPSENYLTTLYEDAVDEFKCNHMDEVDGSGAIPFPQISWG